MFSSGEEITSKPRHGRDMLLVELLMENGLEKKRKHSDPRTTLHRMKNAVACKFHGNPSRKGH